MRQLRIVPQTPGPLAGGLFNLTTQGQGVVVASFPTVQRCFWAATSGRHSLPRRRRSVSRRTCSHRSRTTSHRTVSLAGLDKSFQPTFHGPGSVVVQPNEGPPAVAWSEARRRRRSRPLHYPCDQQRLCDECRTVGGSTHRSADTVRKVG